jgi:hypothetical protein
MSLLAQVHPVLNHFQRSRLRHLRLQGLAAIMLQQLRLPGAKVTWTNQKRDLNPIMMKDPKEQTTPMVSLNLVMVQVHHDDTKCLVPLADKVNNWTMLCGFDDDTCPRCKHQDLQSNSEKISAVGYYIATLNWKKTVLDAINDTHITEVDMVRHKEENHHLLLEAVGGSDQKTSGGTCLQSKVSACCPN